jgi:hypothetical protein
VTCTPPPWSLAMVNIISATAVQESPATEVLVVQNALAPGN